MSGAFYLGVWQQGQIQKTRAHRVVVEQFPFVATLSQVGKLEFVLAPLVDRFSRPAYMRAHSCIDKFRADWLISLDTLAKFGLKRALSFRCKFSIGD